MTSLRTKRSVQNSHFKIDRQLGVLFDSANDFQICMLDHQGRIVGWNLSAERSTGYAASEVLGKSYAMFVSKAEMRDNILKKALSTAARTGQFIAEGIRVRKDGSHFFARSILVPMKEKLGHVRFFVLMVQDISKGRALEQKREEFINIAAHELKNPITTLSLYSELLAKRLELERDKKNLYMLRDIQSQATRLITLVDDLLVVGKIENNKLELHKEIFKPAPFIKKTLVDFQSHTSSHRIIFSGACERLVRADKGRVAQVLINLIANAVKYSPHARKVEVLLRARNGKCIISVQDHGTGIEKKDQRQIFTRYFRASDAEAGNIAGSGLGLYIAKAIMKKHRERLWLQSVPGKGSTFSFSLPFSVIR